MDDLERVRYFLGTKGYLQAKLASRRWRRGEGFERVAVAAVPQVRSRAEN